MPNRLADATSPYLLQHKDNPVDWWPWEDEAFAEARRRDVPVLVSIGYAACHWCHVMAHESFEDEETAAQLNADFVAVKVDREERPDVDAVYMEATQALTGHGGWPMTVFTTPDGKPFFCGTYFPPTPRHGMPSFRQLLASVAQTWKERRDEVLEAGQRIVTGLAERSVRQPSEGSPPSADHLEAAVRGLASTYDRVHGGFGGAPKFPPSMVLEQLLRHHARTGDEEALRLVEDTCEAMARGGIYDQLAGGFARYSVDAAWVVPHFEKMLYDNALLLRVYTHLWRTTGSELARRVALDTAGWMQRELRTAEGGYASALDADTDGVEGLTYVWTPEQLTDVLGETDGRWATELLVVTAGGTFEHGASTLQLPKDPDDPERWAGVRARLLAARDGRPQPGRDDKVVAAWNGLAVAALAEAGALLDRPELVEAATAAADLLESVHLVDGRLRRVSRDGAAGRPAGVLEDYADVAEGLLTLYAVTGEPHRLALAGRLLDVVLDRFADGTGGFFDTADDRADPQLAAMRRPQDPTDNATPSGQAAAAGALLTYAAYTGSSRHREAAERALAVYAPLAAGHARFAGWGLAVAEALADGPREVAVLGPAGHPGTVALHRAALRGVAPAAAVAVGDPDRLPDPEVPLLADRPLRDGLPTAYVCRHFVCDAPTTDPDVLARALAVPSQ
ncbi:MAG TPA: thioredoxin domain-containing protein [Actinomycetes bacterium]|nr:thioredoxin domain-containing protein [Actinomycetes bacterium]